MRPERSVAGRDVAGLSTAGGGPAPELDQIRQMDEATLAVAWREATGAPPSVAMPPRVLRLALAWEIQASVAGGLAPEVARKLDRVLAGGWTRSTALPAQRLRAAPGSVLVRDWGGRPHRVEVLAEGSWRWDSQVWRSLSAIARAITGTRRNGPAFFGLRDGPGREDRHGTA